MNFDLFESVESTKTRQGSSMIKEQAFANLKYRKSPKKIKGKDGAADTELMEGRFYVSKARFQSEALLTNGLRQFTVPSTGETILAVVGIKDAQLLKDPKKGKDGLPGKKSTSFTSAKLEAALENLKVINTTVIGENQFIDLTSIATNVAIKGVSCINVFTLSKGQEKPKVENPVAKLVTEQTVTPLAKSPATASWD